IVESLFHEDGLDLEIEQSLADLGQFQSFRRFSGLGLLSGHVILEFFLEALGGDLLALHLADGFMLAVGAVASRLIHHEQAPEDENPENADDPFGLLFYPIQCHCGSTPILLCRKTRPRESGPATGIQSLIPIGSGIAAAR